MDILVACHNEAEDPILFIYKPPLFDSPRVLKADYVDPYSSDKKWEDYSFGSKDIIWTQHCPIYTKFSKLSDLLYHDSIFYNLFDDGWNILRSGGSIVIPFPKTFRNLRKYSRVMKSANALNNFKTVLKGLLEKHPWETHIVRRESMPLIISEWYEQEEHDEYVLFTKPVVERRSKTRKNRRGVAKRDVK